MKKIVISVFLVLAAAYLIGGMYRITSQSHLQGGIAEQVLRFHVLANSDRDEDQQLKMKVKQEILAYLAPILDECENLEDTKKQIVTNTEQIQKVAEAAIRQEGYMYPVTVELKSAYFPVKTYGDCTFPAGKYEALRVLIGRADGHNWWCILYPDLCFVEPCYGEVEEEEKEKLENVLTEEEYQSILEVPQENIRIESCFINWIESVKNAQIWD